MSLEKILEQILKLDAIKNIKSEKLDYTVKCDIVSRSEVALQAIQSGIYDDNLEEVCDSSYCFVTVEYGIIKSIKFMSYAFQENFGDEISMREFKEDLSNALRIEILEGN